MEYVACKNVKVGGSYGSWPLSFISEKDLIEKASVIAKWIESTQKGNVCLDSLFTVKSLVYMLHHHHHHHHHRLYSLGWTLASSAYTWVISKVLHNVRFLFNSFNAKLNPICHLLALLEVHHIPHVSRLRVKNKFILQSTFTGLQCNLHCTLLQPSNVWASLILLSGRLRCWCAWLLGLPH